MLIEMRELIKNNGQNLSSYHQINVSGVDKANCKVAKLMLDFTYKLFSEK